MSSSGNRQKDKTITTTEFKIEQKKQSHEWIHQWQSHLYPSEASTNTFIRTANYVYLIFCLRNIGLRPAEARVSPFHITKYTRLIFIVIVPSDSWTNINSRAHAIPNCYDYFDLSLLLGVMLRFICSNESVFVSYVRVFFRVFFVSLPVERGNGVGWMRCNIMCVCVRQQIFFHVPIGLPFARFRICICFWNIIEGNRCVEYHLLCNVYTFSISRDFYPIMSTIHHLKHHRPSHRILTFPKPAAPTY